MISRLLTFWIPLTWLLLVTLCAVMAGWMPLPAPDIMDYDHQNASPGTMVVMPGTPSQTYWLGTDAMGRDMLSRVIVGARVWGSPPPSSGLSSAAYWA